MQIRNTESKQLLSFVYCLGVLQSQFCCIWQTTWNRFTKQKQSS